VCAWVALSGCIVRVHCQGALSGCIVRVHRQGASSGCIVRVHSQGASSGCNTVATTDPSRALKLWMVLRMYGAEKLRELIRHHLAIAAWLVDQVRALCVLASSNVLRWRCALVVSRLRQRTHNAHCKHSAAPPITHTPRHSFNCLYCRCCCCCCCCSTHQIRADPRFELAAPPRLGLVCFRLAGVDNATNVQLLEAVNATGRLCVWTRGSNGGSIQLQRWLQTGRGAGHSLFLPKPEPTATAPGQPTKPRTGKAFMVGTELDGRFTLRMAVGSPQTQPRHVAAAWDLVRREADRLLAGAAA